MSSTRHVTITNRVEILPLEVLIRSFLSELAHAPPNTVRAVTRDLAALSGYLSETLGVVPFVHDVTESLLQAFIADQLTHYSPATAARRAASVKRFGKWLADTYSLHDKARSLKVPRKTRPEFKGLTEHQHRRVMSLLPSCEPRRRFIAELLLMTGIRCEEARTLRLGQISDDWRWLLAVEGKGEKERDLPISTELRRCLMRYLVWREQWPTLPEFPLIVSPKCSKRSKPDSYRVAAKTIWRDVHAVLTEAGVSKKLSHPHTLRHTFARRTLEHVTTQRDASRALLIVRELLGHASVNTTLVYLTNERDELYATLEGLT